jgi:spore germination protein
VRPALLVAGLVLLLAGCTVAAPGPTPTSDHPDGAFEVLGFQEGYRDLVIAENAAALTYVGVDGVSLTDGGATLPLPGEGELAALEAAHDAGLGAELLFSNFDGELNDFSPGVAATLLGSADNRAAVIASLVTAVDEQSWDGVMIDLESMTGQMTDDLTTFAVELRAALPADARLDIALMAATDEAGYRWWGYDLPALADAVDRMTIMTYDQHGTWSDAGPVGALDWQREVVAELRRQVPDEPIDLGVAAYGYLWHGDESRSVSPAEARELAGDAATFDEQVGEWTATLDDGTVLWWSDTRSRERRVQLAHELGLDGVAIWSLGLTDPLVTAE